MDLLLSGLVLLGLFALFHTYIFYPFLLQVLAMGKSPHQQFFPRQGVLPRVSVILSAYNEESVISRKMDSLLGADYPSDRIHIFVGSDHSTDRTNAILQDYEQRCRQVTFLPYPQRRGKPSVVNALVAYALDQHSAGPDHLFLITDASVILTPEAVWNLARHFHDERIAIVDAHMRHTGFQSAGISLSENQYISSEVLIKHLESLVWQKMAGPFGGCFMLRSNYFRPVPENFLVDDFYLTMRVFEQGGLAINDLEAVCYEPVSQEISEEFRRKARISAGNWQNMAMFRHLWWPPTGPLSFALFSHKILRWLGPFFMVISLAGSGLLALRGNFFFELLFVLLTVFLVIVPLLDFFLQSRNIHWLPLRHVRYFVLMNLALLLGFFRFIKGIKSNVWEPPKRSGSI